jgi:hypothetical protein
MSSAGYLVFAGFFLGSTPKELQKLKGPRGQGRIDLDSCSAIKWEKNLILIIKPGSLYQMTRGNYDIIRCIKDEVLCFQSVNCYLWYVF